MDIRAIKISGFHYKISVAQTVHNDAIKAEKCLFFGNWMPLKIQARREESITITVEWHSKNAIVLDYLHYHLLTKHLDCIKLHRCTQL